MFSSHDVVTIGRPRGAVDQTKGFIGYLANYVVMQINRPNIIPCKLALAIAIAGKGDAFAIWTETGLHVPSNSTGQLHWKHVLLTIGTCNRHQIEVTE